MNSFGRLFRVSIFGESHGNSTGIVIDGCPAGISLDQGDFEKDLSRRRSGRSGTTPRREADMPVFASGLHNGRTTGSPMAIFFDNSDTRPSDYEQFREVPRPGHADFTASKKWKNFNDNRGGGHFSGRITTGLVAAGVVAKKIISPAIVAASLLEAGGESNIDAAVQKAMEDKDSIGGIIECTGKNIPAGLGEPFFDSVESVISHTVFSVPAIKAIEFGSGFASARMRGSRHNDPLISPDGKTSTNNAGGINGGITNGNDLVFRIAVKPTSSIALPQETVNIKSGKITTLETGGRHDSCIALRMPVIIEAATALALADLLLIHRGINNPDTGNTGF